MPRLRLPLLLPALALLALGCGQAAPAEVADVVLAFGDLGSKPLDSAAVDSAGSDSAAEDAVSAEDDVAADVPDSEASEVSQGCEFPAKPAKGEPGFACTGNGDCDSGVCVDGPTGKICSVTCQDCCPTGFKCEAQSAASDAIFVCRPKWLALCRPCNKDAECADAGQDALCVSYGGDGSFCGAPCATTSDCPQDYSCSDASGATGTAKQCVRTIDACSCSPAATAKGAQTTCHVQNAVGTCSGVRKCAASGLTACPAPTPATETCGNGIDDDCNGQTDENGALGCVTYYPDKDGDGDGLLGATGACQCGPTADFHAKTNGDCNDAAPKINHNAVEICDGVDNNCDGQTDEGCDDDGDGYCDADMLYAPAPICPKGGNDCDDLNALVHPGALEVCGNGLDDNCDGLTDGGLDVDGCVPFYLDGDGDGFGGGAGKCLCSGKGLYTAAKSGDCDDKNANVNPGTAEVCGNGVDDNCDGLTDEANAKGCKSAWTDGDADGYGAGNPVCLCAADIDHPATQGGDCDDTKAAIHPGAMELCNGFDDNCDGVTDEAGASGCVTYYADKDGDGYGDPGSGQCVCASAANGGVKDHTDCNDANPAIHPGATEICNGQDDNCDGSTDGANTADCVPYYIDQDGDGWGVTGNASCLCGPAGAYKVAQGGDCNDQAYAIHPSALETCDGVDNNCNGATDEAGALGCKNFFRDDDGDGFGVTGDTQCLCAATGSYKASVGGDCDDTAAAVHPKGLETCNGIDDDCDGVTDPTGAEGCKLWFVDGDGDGYGTYQQASKCLCVGITGYASVGGDCADSDASVHPGATEVCNGKDDNCDGSIDPKGAGGCVNYDYDGDGDGYGLTGTSECACGPDGPFSATVGGDCNDVSAAIHPDAAETCNAIDDNCNGQTDEGLATTTWYLDADHDGYGTGVGTASCTTVPGLTATVNGDCNDASAAVRPGADEVCGNNIDDNCNGQTDENCCPIGKVTANGVCIDPTTMALNVGGKTSVSSATITLYVVPPGNLLVNGGAESNSFAGWSKTASDDWSISSTDYGLPIPFGAKVFRPSYFTSYLQQTVDLTAAGIPAAGLDAKSVISYGAFGMGWGCKDSTGGCGTPNSSDDTFRFDAFFYDGAGTELGSWSSQTYSLLLGAWAAPYQSSITYPTGTRKVMVQVSGSDGEGWGGYYGPSIDGAFLCTAPCRCASATTAAPGAPGSPSRRPSPVGSSCPAAAPRP